MSLVEELDGVCCAAVGERAAEKAERVLSLYREPPADGPVVCFDEMGPIQLIPHHGSGWAAAKLPERLRATYSKKGGTRYLYGAYDVHDDRLFGRLRPRKGQEEVIRFLTTIRMRYDPRLRLYLVMDNLSCHWTPKVREWAAKSNVELVPTPTYASYLNRIECHFWALSEFVIKNADYESWDTLALAMADHIRYRNGRTETEDSPSSNDDSAFQMPGRAAGRHRPQAIAGPVSGSQPP